MTDKRVNIKGMTVKDLKEYLDHYQDNDEIRVVGAYRETESVTRLVDVNFFGVLKPGEYEYPILLMEITEEEETAK